MEFEPARDARPSGTYSPPVPVGRRRGGTD